MQEKKEQGREKKKIKEGGKRDNQAENMKMYKGRIVWKR